MIPRPFANVGTWKARYGCRLVSRLGMYRKGLRSRSVVPSYEADRLPLYGSMQLDISESDKLIRSIVLLAQVTRKSCSVRKQTGSKTTSRV
jgi:hypothetical protein